MICISEQDWASTEEAVSKSSGRVHAPNSSQSVLLLRVYGLHFSPHSTVVLCPLQQPVTAAHCLPLSTKVLSDSQLLCLPLYQPALRDTAWNLCVVDAEYSCDSGDEAAARAALCSTAVPRSELLVDCFCFGPRAPVVEAVFKGHDDDSIRAYQDAADGLDAAAVQPVCIPQCGGTLLYVQGRHFRRGCDVSISGRSCSNVRLLSERVIVCDAPAWPQSVPALVDAALTVRNAEGARRRSNAVPVLYRTTFWSDRVKIVVRKAQRAVSGDPPLTPRSAAQASAAAASSSPAAVLVIPSAVFGEYAGSEAECLRDNYVEREERGAWQDSVRLGGATLNISSVASEGNTRAYTVLSEEVAQQLRCEKGRTYDEQEVRASARLSSVIGLYCSDAQAIRVHSLPVAVLSRQFDVWQSVFSLALRDHIQQRLRELDTRRYGPQPDANACIRVAPGEARQCGEFRQLLDAVQANDQPAFTASLLALAGCYGFNLRIVRHTFVDTFVCLFVTKTFPSAYLRHCYLHCALRCGQMA